RLPGGGVSRPLAQYIAGEGFQVSPSLQPEKRLRARRIRQGGRAERCRERLPEGFLQERQHPLRVTGPLLQAHQRGQEALVIRVAGASSRQLGASLLRLRRLQGL